MGNNKFECLASSCLPVANEVWPALNNRFDDENAIPDSAVGNPANTEAPARHINAVSRREKVVFQRALIHWCYGGAVYPSAVPVDPPKFGIITPLRAYTLPLSQGVDPWGRGRLGAQFEVWLALRLHARAGGVERTVPLAFSLSIIYLISVNSGLRALRGTGRIGVCGAWRSRVSRRALPLCRCRLPPLGQSPFGRSWRANAYEACFMPLIAPGLVLRWNTSAAFRPPQLQTPLSRAKRCQS